MKHKRALKIKTIRIDELSLDALRELVAGSELAYGEDGAEERKALIDYLLSLLR